MAGRMSRGYGGPRLAVTQGDGFRLSPELRGEGPGGGRGVVGVTLRDTRFGGMTEAAGTTVGTQWAWSFLDAGAWIPAFAGITRLGGTGNDEVGAVASGLAVGLRILSIVGLGDSFGVWGSSGLVVGGFRGERFATRSVWGCSSVAWRAWPAVLVGESGRYSPGRFCCARSTSAGLVDFVRHERVTPDQSRPALPFAGWRKAEFVLRRALSHVARGGVGTSQDGFVTHSSCGCSTSPPLLGSACNGASDRTLPRTERRRIEDTKRFRACQVGSTALCDCMTHGMPGGISDTGSDCVPFRGRPPVALPRLDCGGAAIDVPRRRGWGRWGDDRTYVLWWSSGGGTVFMFAIRVGGWKETVWRVPASAPADVSVDSCWGRHGQGVFSRFATRRRS